jgi:serine/threonine-protein kinase RsbT
MDVIAARQVGRQLATDLGFPRVESTLIATAISELARNIVMHGQGGQMTLRKSRELGRDCLVVIAQDNGPGISDIDRAMQEGYSTTGSLGVGLPGARRLMDEMVIESSPNQGTTVVAKKYVNK